MLRAEILLTDLRTLRDRATKTDAGREALPHLDRAIVHLEREIERLKAGPAGEAESHG